MHLGCLGVRFSLPQHRSLCCELARLRAGGGPGPGSLQPWSWVVSILFAPLGGTEVSGRQPFCLETLGHARAPSLRREASLEDAGCQAPRGTAPVGLACGLLAPLSEGLLPGGVGGRGQQGVQNTATQTQTLLGQALPVGVAPQEAQAFQIFTEQMGPGTQRV